MPQPTSPRSRVPIASARAALAAAVALAAASALVACGGSSSPTGAAAERSKEQADEAKLAKFGKCLREHGIEAQTSPSGPGQQGFGIRVKGTGGPAKMEAAQRACARLRPAPHKVNLSPQQKVAAEEGVLRFAKCMREHGIDVHASTAEGGAQIQIRSKAGEGPNPESPAFQSAQKACQKLLPFKGHPPGAGPPEAGHGTSGGAGTESRAGASIGG
jgi:hypothetical protein